MHSFSLCLIVLLSIFSKKMPKSIKPLSLCKHVYIYPAPLNLNYNYNHGVYARGYYNKPSSVYTITKRFTSGKKLAEKGAKVVSNHCNNAAGCTQGISNNPQTPQLKAPSHSGASNDASSSTASPNTSNTNTSTVPGPKTLAGNNNSVPKYSNIPSVPKQGDVSTQPKDNDLLAKVKNLTPISSIDFSKSQDMKNKPNTSSIPKPSDVSNQQNKNSWFNFWKSSNPNSNVTSTNTTVTSKETSETLTSEQSCEDLPNKSKYTSVKEFSDTEVIHYYWYSGLFKFKKSKNGDSYEDYGAITLSKEAHRIYTRLQNVRTIMKRKDPDNIANENIEGFIVGTLEINENTFIPLAIQTHLVVGIYDYTRGIIEIISMFTSEKGISETGQIGGPALMTKVLDNNIMGEKKDQYVSVVFPPLAVKPDQFTESEVGTSFIQKYPEVFDHLVDIKKNTDKYEPVPYNATGVTVENVHIIAEFLNIPTPYSHDKELPT